LKAIQDSTHLLNSTATIDKAEQDSTVKKQASNLLPKSDHTKITAEIPIVMHQPLSGIDTIRVSVGNVQRYEEKNIFTSHELKSDFVRPVSFEQKNPDWFVVVLLILSAGIALLRVVYGRAAAQILKAFMSTGLTNQVVRDENIIIQQASVFMSIIFYLSSALLMYKLSVQFDWNHPWIFDGFGRFILFAFLISMIYSGKMVLLKLIGYIFNQERSISTYIFNVFLLNNMLGILFTPLILVWVFVDSAFVSYIPSILLVLFSLSLLVRYFRGLGIARSIQGMSWMHIFLYFCALELVPWALVIKWALV